MHKPIITLKRIQYSDRLSEETAAYAADVYVDGKLFCHVRNDGHGGCDRHDPPRGMHEGFYDRLKALDEQIKATYPAEVTDHQIGGKPFVMEQSLETLCSDALNRWQLERQFKRIRKPMAFDPATQQIWTFKLGVAPEKIAARYPTYTMLNDLPSAQAFDLFAHAIAE